MFKRTILSEVFQIYKKYKKADRVIFVIFFFLMAYLNYSLIRITISLTAFGLQLQRVNTEHKLY